MQFRSFTVAVLLKTALSLTSLLSAIGCLIEAWNYNSGSTCLNSCRAKFRPKLGYLTEDKDISAYKACAKPCNDHFLLFGVVLALSILNIVIVSWFLFEERKLRFKWQVNRKLFYYAIAVLIHVTAISCLGFLIGTSKEASFDTEQSRAIQALFFVQGFILVIFALEFDNQKWPKKSRLQDEPEENELLAYGDVWPWLPLTFKISHCFLSLFGSWLILFTNFDRFYGMKAKYAKMNEGWLDFYEIAVILPLFLWHLLFASTFCLDFNVYRSQKHAKMTLAGYFVETAVLWSLFHICMFHYGGLFLKAISILCILSWITDFGLHKFFFISNSPSNKLKLSTSFDITSL